MNKYQKICEDLCRNPYNFQLSNEDALAILGDPNVPDEFKDKIIDIRDKMPGSNDLRSINYIKRKQEQSELQQQFNDLGGFVFAVYQRLGLMFDDKVLSPEDKSKILLLATYMGYDNKLKFKNNVPILKSHLPIVLRVNEKTARTFLNKIKDLGLITINSNKELFLSDSLFIKGKTCNNSQIKDTDFGYTRIFVNSYQYLYENIPKSKLKYLGLIYNMLGYVNFFHNVLVTNNPNEKDIEHIEPMEFKEMLILCGYKQDMTSQAQGSIKRQILSIKLENGMPLFAIVNTDDISKILINPYVTYASSNIDTWTSTLRIIFETNK